MKFAWSSVNIKLITLKTHNFIYLQSILICGCKIDYYKKSETGFERKNGLGEKWEMVQCRILTLTIAIVTQINTLRHIWYYRI